MPRCGEAVVMKDTGLSPAISPAFRVYSLGFRALVPLSVLRVISVSSAACARPHADTDVMGYRASYHSLRKQPTPLTHKRAAAPAESARRRRECGAQGGC